jgi:hypothetical protein
MTILFIFYFPSSGAYRTGMRSFLFYRLGNTGNVKIVFPVGPPGDPILKLKPNLSGLFHRTRMFLIKFACYILAPFQKYCFQGVLLKLIHSEKSKPSKSTF